MLRGSVQSTATPGVPAVTAVEAPAPPAPVYAGEQWSIGAAAPAPSVSTKKKLQIALDDESTAVQATEDFVQKLSVGGAAAAGRRSFQGANPQLEKLVASALTEAAAAPDVDDEEMARMQAQYFRRGREERGHGERKGPGGAGNKRPRNEGRDDDDYSNDEVDGEAAAAAAAGGDDDGGSGSGSGSDSDRDRKRQRKHSPGGSRHGGSGGGKQHGQQHGKHHKGAGKGRGRYLRLAGK